MSTNDSNAKSSTSVPTNTLDVQEISTLIDGQHFSEALSYLMSLTEQQIYDNTWDLCTYLFHLLEKPSDKLCNEYEIYSQDALKHVAEHGNPREMLIIMLEQSDKFISDEAFVFHIQLFLIIIKRLPLKPSLITSIDDILSLLKCHLTTLELPTINNDFAGKDLLVYNHDHRVTHLLKLTQFYVDFICQLRDYFSTTTMNKIFPILAKYLISLLQEPLSSLSYEPIDSQESSSFTSIRPLLDCLFTLNPNPIQLINDKEQQSVFVYLLLTKNHYFSLLPCVYSPYFYLILSIPFIQQLSNDRERVMLTEKACVLVSNVCSRLKPNKEFDSTLLDNNDIHTLIDTLKILMVQSPARQYAPLTIGAYRSLFRSFNPLGRYTFLRQQLAKTPCAEDSYRTFLCTLVKDEFLYDYRSLSNEIYKGLSLFQLLDHLCRLPNGIESDLLEIYDCLCSTLNFIRFIGLIDKQNINRTLLWTERLNHLNETFIKPLRKSIELARAHYKLEIKNRKEDNKPQKMDTEILVDSKPLSMPSKREQLETLHSAVTKFDILDCILSTLSETFGGEL
ncbi:unnamed protein product [Rotaria sp. Silwood1]|nr:unnamed protein product [Rotaria sp. Silwood1]CAF0746160.1 unnamed protein product [Rotaria sp. Silwood1]CAF3356481.1 unnamed protein product [Rotaria sp. Silwood1]CAF4512236.1 unnamed protein product [Rotaria sp. Silwood1]